MRHLHLLLMNVPVVQHHILLSLKRFLAHRTFEVLLIAVFRHVPLQLALSCCPPTTDATNRILLLQMCYPQMRHHRTSKHKGFWTELTFDLLPALVHRHHMQSSLVMRLKQFRASEALVFLVVYVLHVWSELVVAAQRFPTYGASYSSVDMLLFVFPQVILVSTMATADVAQ